MAGKNKKVEPLDVFTCDLNGIANIEASAGTGKTWAICGLYVRLIAEMDLPVDQILVVTFTNAATAELRSRIRDRMVEVQHCLDTGRCLSPDPFAAGFLSRMDRLGIRAKAGENLKNALLSFEESAIFTIHSFCQRTLGELPFSAVQPFNVEVEADDSEIIRETAADYWRCMTQHYTADEINALIQNKINPSWIAGEIRRLLNRPLAKLVMPETNPAENPASRRAVWIKRFILKTAPRVIRKVKQDRHVISYNDMLYNLHDVLTLGQFPWLAGVLRKRFPVALIDEFQDTDPLQFEIFRAIYFDDGTLFMVGDPKQAIYSFRNADLNTYLAARHQAQRQWTMIHNQRSEEKLIFAINALFGANKNVFGDGEKIPYRDVRRGTKPLKELQGDPEPREPFSVWLFKTGSKAEPLKAEDARSLALAATAKEMARLIDGGMRGTIQIGDENLQPRDIAVLVRTKAQGRQVKEALADYGIGSVDLTERSVFATVEAEEMKTVLRAIAEPSRAGLLRAALSTMLLGFGSRELADLNADEAEFNRIVERVNEYRQAWLGSGFGAMWRRLIAQERVIERLLPLKNGERKITNLMHLMELATGAEEMHRGIEALLRWLSEKRSAGEEEDVAQLRLESDENLVQIVTKHKAKGLEWPIVFCPFVWSDRNRSSKDDICTYHEGDTLVLDYAADDEKKRKQEGEAGEERVRLIYVALTRAVNRCYIVAGPFWQPSGKSATEKKAKKSILNWIVAGDDTKPGVWSQKKEVTVDSVHQAWQRLLTSNKGIGGIPWPDRQETVRPVIYREKKKYEARKVGRLPGVAWKISSYSSLTASSFEGGRQHEPAAQDYDVIPLPVEEHDPHDLLQTPRTTLSGDIIDFPAGTTTGHCLHAVFERIDFQDDKGWKDVVTNVLANYPPVDAAEKRDDQVSRIHRMLKDVMNTTLPTGFKLGDVARAKRLSEFEFAYSVRHLEHKKLKDLLDKHGCRIPPLDFPDLEGYLRGFIDLVFEHAGQWYVLDWKSNKLGTHAEAYSRPSVDEAMFSHAYEFQGLIYLTALHRYLKLRIHQYDYNRHMGGILYLFVRGVRPAWPSAGIWHKLPEPALIESLDALLSSEKPRTVWR